MDITAQKRDILGRKVKALRKEGFIPAELYGHGVDNVHLSVSEKDFQKVYSEAGESTVVNLAFEEGGDTRPVIIHDVQRDPVTEDILTVDFYQVRLDEKITLSVPLEFIGVSSAVKDKGGVLVKSLQEIEVEALPTNIPHSISVDIARLNEIGDTIYVKDLVLPESVEATVEDDTAVATVTEKMEEEEAQPAAEVDVSAVKTESEVKKAGEKKDEESDASSE